MIKFNRATPNFILLVTAAETNIDLNEFMVLLKQNYIVFVHVRFYKMAQHHGCSLAIDNCHKTPHKRREGDA
jgi:hypothetical protein